VPPRLYRLTADRAVDVAGVATTFERGSLASKGDPVIAAVGASYWEVVQS
jgi:hypothetical protein